MDVGIWWHTVPCPVKGQRWQRALQQCVSLEPDCSAEGPVLNRRKPDSLKKGVITDFRKEAHKVGLDLPDHM